MSHVYRSYQLFCLYTSHHSGFSLFKSMSNMYSECYHLYFNSQNGIDSDLQKTALKYTLGLFLISNSPNIHLSTTQPVLFIHKRNTPEKKKSILCFSSVYLHVSNVLSVKTLTSEARITKNRILKGKLQ